MLRGIPEHGEQKLAGGIDAVDPVSSASSGQATGYVLMEMDGGTVLLSQQDIESIETTAELTPADGETPLAGHLPFAGAQWPVFCLDDKLSLLDRIPPSRGICLLLKTAERGFGLLCDGIRPLGADALRVQGLPACMAVSGTPLEGLAIHDGKVVSLISAGALSSHLEQRLEIGH